MIPIKLSYWFSIGAIYLLWLTIQDYRNERIVDDRKNWFMLGLSISIISHVPTTLGYKLTITAVIIIFNIFMKKFNVDIGEADINSLSWILTGLGLMHYYYLLYFFVFFSILTGLYSFLKTVVFKYHKPVAFYGVILTSFLLTTGLISII